MTFRLLVLLAVLGLPAAAPAGPSMASASGKPVSTETKPTETKPTQTKPTQTKPTQTKSASLPPPVVFFLAKGEPNACGPGCQEWIAADGTFDPGADGRLRALLKKLGGRKP